jgi:hypothetical protein
MPPISLLALFVYLLTEAACHQKITIFPGQMTWGECDTGSSGGDGVLSGTDYILFFSNGVDRWIKDSINKRFAHKKKPL